MVIIKGVTQIVKTMFLQVDNLLNLWMNLKIQNKIHLKMIMMTGKAYLHPTKAKTEKYCKDLLPPFKLQPAKKQMVK